MRRLAQLLAPLALAACGMGTPLAAQDIYRFGAPGGVRAPVTTYVSRALGSVVYPLPHAYIVWANRSFQRDHTKSPNILYPLPSINLRAEFSTFIKADCATLTTERYILGLADWSKPITGWHDSSGVHPGCGLGVVPAASARPDGLAHDGSGTPVITDKFVIPPTSVIQTAASHLTEIFLDDETHDGHTAADRLPLAPGENPNALYLLSKFSETAHAAGKKAGLYVNPWLGPLMASSGLDKAHAPASIVNFDHVTNMVAGLTATAAAEYAYGASIVPPAHELVAPWLTLSCADMRFLRAQWATKHFPGFLIFDAGVDPSAPANAAKIAALATGQGC